ncbi:MAG TPA: hypothetical protein VF221_08730, partial [Chloroflexota bacterium]
VTTPNAASGSGTMTVTFKKSLSSGQVTILDLVALGGNNTTAPIVTANLGAASGSSSTATANLPSAPSSLNAEIAFLSAPRDLGTTAPTATPAMTSVFYSHQSPGSAAVYSTVPAHQTESVNVGSGTKNWGTLAFEIKNG